MAASLQYECILCGATAPAKDVPPVECENQREINGEQKKCGGRLKKCSDSPLRNQLLRFLVNSH